MTYFQNSLFVNIVLRFWNFVCRKYSESLTGALIGRLVHKFRSGVVWRFLTHDGPLAVSWRSSFFCRSLEWILDLPVRLCVRIGQRFPNSLTAALCRSLTAPLLGLMLFLLLVIPQDYWNNLYSLVMIVGILLIYLASSLSGTPHRLQLADTGFWTVLFFFIIALSWLWSQSVSASTRFLCFSLTCALTVLLFISAVDTEEKLLTVVRLCAVGLAVCCVYALYQRVVGVKINPSLTDLSLHSYMPGRVFSFFENPNSYANILVFFAPLMLCMTVYSRRRIERLAFFAVFLLCGIALLMTYSRGGWLALAFSVFILLLFFFPRWVPLLMILCVAAVPLLPDNILNRLLSVFNFSDSSTYTRGYIYSAMLKLIRNHPLFGVGLGADTVRRAVKEESVYIASAAFSHGHNIYFQIWAESGVFALIAFLGSMFSGMRSGYRAVKTVKKGSLPRGVVIGCIAGLSGALLFGITDYAWSYPRIMVLFWFLFSLLAAGTRIINKEVGITHES